LQASQAETLGQPGIIVERRIAATRMRGVRQIGENCLVLYLRGEASGSEMRGCLNDKEDGPKMREKNQGRTIYTLRGLK
jgi:hypothetical protein